MNGIIISRKKRNLNMTRQQLEAQANAIFSKYDLGNLSNDNLVQITKDFQDKGWHVLPCFTGRNNLEGLSIFTNDSNGEEIAYNPLKKV